MFAFDENPECCRRGPALGASAAGAGFRRRGCGTAVIIWHYPQGDFSPLLSDIIIIISPFCRESNSQACKSRLLDFIGSLRNPAIDFGN